MAFPIQLLLICLVPFSSGFAIPFGSQSPLASLSKDDSVVSHGVLDPPSDEEPMRIAIIGSGITGATAAYNIYEEFRLKRSPQPEITVYERNPIIGGRFTQAYAFDDPQYPVDTCAATFSLGDQCITQSVLSVGLMTSTASFPQNADTGIWNGQAFVGFVEQGGFRNMQSWSFFRKLKWFERYGSAPMRLETYIANTRRAFTTLLSPVRQGGAPGGGLPKQRQNLRKEVANAGLTAVVRDSTCKLEGPAAVLDCEDDKERLFIDEVFNAGGRERYFADVGELNALETLFGYEGGMQVSVVGGNLRLIDRLLALSRANMRLSTTVRGLEKVEDGQGRWRVHSVNKPEGPGRPGSVETLSSDDFNVVIVASSLSLANLTLAPGTEDQSGLRQSYNDSYVTHFTTTSALNGSFFGRETGMPQNVLTSSTPRSETSPPFFSLTLIRQLMDPQDSSQTHNLYKIVSREVLSNEEIGSYLTKDTDDPTEPLISWIDRQPLPASVPTVEDFDDLLEDVEIAPGLFYAGGGEQVVAIAEFGCRMGLNAARLVAGRSGV